MRVIVTGSRTWRDAGPIRDALAALPQDSLIVHGAHWEGADAIADSAARELGLRVEQIPAQWCTHGRAAGPLRNEAMAAAGADLCLAFRAEGPSAGTDDMMRRAEAHGIPVRVHCEAESGRRR